MSQKIEVDHNNFPQKELIKEEVNEDMKQNQAPENLKTDDSDSGNGFINPSQPMQHYFNQQIQQNLYQQAGNLTSQYPNVNSQSIHPSTFGYNQVHPGYFAPPVYQGNQNTGVNVPQQTYPNENNTTENYVDGSLGQFAQINGVYQNPPPKFTGEDLEKMIMNQVKVYRTDEENLPRRRILKMEWNGPILEISGYFYFENIPMYDEDWVKKSLLLSIKKLPPIEIPLQDVPITDINHNGEVDNQYHWAGFNGKINFATLIKEKPLLPGDYTVFIQMEQQFGKDSIVKEILPLGNVQDFLRDGFYSTKMEYFSARQVLKYNLLATYDYGKKTLILKSSKLKDFDPQEMSLDSASTQGLFYKAFRTKVFKGLYNLFKVFPIKKNRILFASDSREDMSGNFQYVYEELLKRDENFDFRFMLKGSIDEKKSFKEIISLAYNMATSKNIILDDFYPMVYPLKIRKGAELIQLWHAVGAFKTFGYSRIGRPGGPSPKSKNHRNYTKAIVSSKNVAKHYAEGFGIPIENVVATGVPRTDIFFDEEYKKNKIAELHAEYPFLKDKKVIMFAPTFRGNGQSSAHYPMEVLNLEKLYHSLKDEYVFIYKIHPFVKNDFSIPYEFSDFFYDLSHYREINDLLFITDILITDYSSVCFEFALLNRPMLFFAFDIEQYVQKRDFYYDYHSFIPGPLVKTTDEIISKIQNKEFKMDRIEPFVKYFFDDLDGKSSARVVDQIILAEPEESNK